MEEPAVGDEHIVTIENVAHGGHFIARLDRRVVFVRHGLIGERVKIRITEVRKKFLRADVVEVLDASDDRVEPPCRFAADCGGCDYQHVSAAGQRELLRRVVAEQLQRIAGYEWTGQVESLDGGLTGWRTRMTWSLTPDGRPGLKKQRSHETIAVDSCVIAHRQTPRIGDIRWTGDSVRTVVSSTGEALASGTPASARGATMTVVAPDQARHLRLTETVHGHELQVRATGFWQVHPRAAETLVDAVLEGAQVRPGDTVFDLFSGAGLFTGFLARATGSNGHVWAVEGDKAATEDARVNSSGIDGVSLRAMSVDRALASWLPAHADVIVADPPRAGAKTSIRAIAARKPRRIVHVACDPASLARDVSLLHNEGYRLASVRAFALFPMTHHVECVAVLIPQRSD